MLVLKWRHLFEIMHSACIFQRLETKRQHPLHLQIMWLSLPATHQQCLCAGAVLLSPLDRLWATPSAVRRWAPTMPLLSATYKRELRTETKVLHLTRCKNLKEDVSMPLFFFWLSFIWELNPKLQSLDYYLVKGHNSRISFVHSTSQMLVVQKLDPNTRYEFVVRLHVDQISSPWSSVVYHRTPPAGKKLIFS